MEKKYYPWIGSLLLVGCVTVFSAAETADNDYVGAGKPQSAYGWGPYTTEGLALSPRILERFGWPAGPCLLQPYATVTAVYDDNVSLTSSEKKDELYMDFMAGIMLLYKSPTRSHFYIDYSADYTTYDEKDSDGRPDQTVKVGWRQQGATAQLNLAHEYREVRDVDILVGTRLVRTENMTLASLDQRVSSKTSLGVEGHHSLYQFDDDRYSDYRDYGAGVRAAWQMRPKTSLYGQVDHGWVDVDESHDAYGSAQYDEVSLGVKGQLRPRLAANGKVGVQHRYFENNDIDDITQEVGSLGITGEPWDLFQTWVNLSVNMRPAINAQGYTVVDTRIEPGISRRLFTDRLVGSLSCMWGQVEYKGKSDTVGTGDEDSRVYEGRTDSYWGYSANVEWWFARYWSAGIGYSHMQNDSDADGRMVDGRPTDDASYEVDRWMARVSFNR